MVACGLVWFLANATSGLGAAVSIGNAAAIPADWPQFRGPRGDGTALDAEPLVNWNEQTGVKWKTELNGRGRSSPVLMGDRVWVTGAVEQGVIRKRIGPDDMQVAEHISLHVICLDRS